MGGLAVLYDLIHHREAVGEGYADLLGTFDQVVVGNYVAVLAVDYPAT